ncbi:MAG: MBL fold metallo-hydrolase [Burkholderiales bacterium]|nr:MBL fold metallo-hydrolase [Burkholderiales bacterium]
MTPEQVLDYPFPNPPAGGSVLEVAPGVNWVRMPLPFALNHINLWVLDDGDAAVIVDSGLGTIQTRELWEQVFADELKGRAANRVIATHCHPDHAGLAGWLTRKFNAPLLMSQADYLTAHAWRDEAAGYTNDNLVAFLRENGLDEARLQGFRERGNHYRRVVPDFPSRYHRIRDGDEIGIGANRWRVIMGYGHAPEHAALYSESLGVLISGDMVLPKISTNVAVTSVDPDANPLGLFLDSIVNYARLPADTLVLPSHGLPFRGLRERVEQLVEHHRLRLAELEEACVEPKAAADVIGTLFRRELDTHQTFFAMGETLAHLNYLVRNGTLARRRDADGVVRHART